MGKFLYDLNTGIFDGLDLSQGLELSAASNDSVLNVLPERLESFKADYRTQEKYRAWQRNSRLTTIMLDFDRAVS